MNVIAHVEIRMTPQFENTLIEDRGGPAPQARRDLVAHARRFFSSCLPRLLAHWTPAPHSATTLIEPGALSTLGEPYLDEMRRRGRPLSVAVFEFGDLREVRSLYGSRISRALMAQVLSQLTAVAGSRGVVARTASAQFTLLLPGWDRTKAARAIHRVMGSPIRVEFESGDDEIVLVPEFRVEDADEDVGSVGDLHRELARELEEVRLRKVSHRQHLARERERHSRPMSLRVAPRKAAVREPSGYRHDIPATMPIALAPAGGFPRR